MFEDLYLKSEQELLADDFIAMYALLVHRNIIGTFLIPGPGQEETWGRKPPFIINNPQLVNLALALGKTEIVRLIITEVEKRRPRGFDNYPEFAGQQFPLPLEGEEHYPSEMVGYLPNRWIEHQFVGLTVIPLDGTEAKQYADTPPMCICVLTRQDDCFDVLVENKYKPGLTSNRTYIVEPVLLAATLNVWEVLPKFVDIGAPIDMQERSHILTSTTPYLMGCIRGNVEWIQAMLRMGYDIDEQHGNNGDTCLHAAAQGGHYPLVKFLIEKGADLTIVNSQDGQSAYSLSVQHHHRHVQALLAEGLLKQRLPLPSPPTLRQRINDMERQDEIQLYLEGYMARTGISKDQLFDQMDIIPYDPYYDFDGTYDPNQELGNPHRSVDADRVQKGGAASFLVEFDGVIYTAGTHSYEEKMKDYLEQEEEKIKQREAGQQREHDELMQLVDTAMNKAILKQRIELEEQKTTPKAVLEKTGRAPVDPATTIADFQVDNLFSHKIIETAARKQHEREEKEKAAMTTHSSTHTHHDEL